METLNRFINKLPEITRKQNKQETQGPRLAHLSKTTTAYLQMPCNFLPVLPQQLEHKFHHAV